MGCRRGIRTFCVVGGAPARDYTASVRQGADNKGIPSVADPFVRAAIDLADLRFGLHSEQADYVDDLGWVRVPVLVVHGTDDHTNPFAVTRQLAEDRPDLVAAGRCRGGRSRGLLERRSRGLSQGGRRVPRQRGPSRVNRRSVA